MSLISPTIIPTKIAVSKLMTPEQRFVDAVPTGVSEDFESTPYFSLDENNNWIEWEEFVDNISPATASIPVSSKQQDQHNHHIPMMPCIHHLKDDHRQRLGESVIGRIFSNALVSRPVGRKEMLSDPEALESMMKEWKGQWSADVYDFTNVREYDDVVREASNKGEEIHMARVHGICVEKHSELPKEDKRRKFKGRGVLLGKPSPRIRTSKQLCSKI